MNYKFDFVVKRKWFFLIFGVLLLIGVASLFIAGLNLGIDFVSGTRLDIEIGQDFTTDEVRDVLAGLDIENPQVRVGGNEGNLAIVNIPTSLDREEVITIREAFQAEYGEQVSLTEQVVSPLIGRELARNAMYALAFASVGIVLYIAVRFEYRFAISAIIALLYDALFTIGVFSILQVEVDLNFIAAILTIIGYSVNDKIVIFDRIRENMKTVKIKEFQDLKDLVNISIQQSLVRSINTGMTVLFAAGALYAFVGESIANFSLALLIGLITGMFSSIFLASQIWVVWKWRSTEKEKQRPATVD